MEQRRAAAPEPGPVRVVAGAGTGKTTVIAERFRRLVESGVPPESILVMTFTEKAAAEMRQRIAATVGEGRALAVGTFHALALGWLRDESGRLGLPAGFGILRGPDRWISLRELMWELGDPALVAQERPDDLVRPLLELQERLKQELVPAGRLAAWAESDPEPQRRELLAAAARLFSAHARLCRREKVLDFDDLLVHLVRLLEEHPEVRERYAARFSWLMVDEYQDTNLAQERVVELLAGPGGNVCVVGDDDQSIYRFRGASRASLERFLASFPGALTRTLGRNRRSSRRIVAAAASLISHNPDRVAKPLAADARLPAGPKVEVWRCASGEQEAAAVAAAVAALVGAGTPADQVAVLGRTHALLRPVAEALTRLGLPHRQRGAQGLLRRSEVRDVIAYLRLLHDPADLLALCRLLSRPPLRLDPEEVLGRLRESQQDPVAALERWQPTRAWARLLRQLFPLAPVCGVQDLLFEVLERTRYLDVHAVGPAGAEVAANISRFGELVHDYCERRRDHSLGRFLEYLDLVLLSGEDEELGSVEDDPAAVQLMTIHQAKGLEFEAVFVPGLVEGRLPQRHRRQALSLPAQLVEPAARGRRDHEAEERRLCYVAMTRARRRLVLSWAERYQGNRVWKPSRFLSELGTGVLERDLTADCPGPAEHAPPKLKEEAVTLSYSAIATYLECPRQHWYRHRLRLPARATVESSFGTVMHLTLMRAGRLRQQGLALELETLEALLGKAWAEVPLPDERRRPVLEALGRRLLRSLWEAGWLEPAPALVEAPFEVVLDGWSLRGVIDRVDRVEGGWRIVDYKTGNSQPKSRLRRDLQLALYALGARLGLGLEGARLELEFAYLRDGRRVLLEATADLLETAKKVGSQVAEGIGAGNFPPRPERRRCTLCAYRLACDAAL